MSDNTISLYKLKNKIRENQLSRFPYDIEGNKSFKLIKESNPKYIDPIFSLQMSSLENSLDKATIILISAAGATGKTCLTENLSYELGIPIFDLSKHEPVASLSLTGLLLKNLNDKFFEYTQSLKDGKSSMIIDALDEGFLKTNVEGFYSFLDNIADLSNGAKGIPFVLLGRTNIVELVTLYLEEKGINVALLQLEPFTIDSAKQFIDKHVKEEHRTKYSSEYNTVRDYIIESIGGFFKNQSEINRKQYYQFIGYAPVLLAIATLLNENNNYHGLFEDLSSKNERSIKLVIDIINKILIRDKKDKIDQLIIPNLIEKDRESSFKELVLKKSYTIEEQCIRLLCKQLGIEINIPITGDQYFDQKYNKQIGKWVEEHPFLSNGKIQNVVFESYIIAKLVEIPEYKKYVFRYLQEQYKNAYMLFYIFHELVNSEKVVDKEFIPYLFASLKALDKKDYHSSMELTTKEVNKETNIITCDLEFFKADSIKEDYIFTVYIEESDNIFLGSDISNIFVDIPSTIALSSDKVDCTPPVSITCNKILCTASDVLINTGTNNESITLQCDEFVTSCSKKGTLPRITYRGNADKKQFKILTKSQMSYPFVIYSADFLKEKLPEDLIEKYIKMRKTLLMFRAHSKGDLARFKDKIDNRIGNSEIGKKIINALLNKGIMYPKELKYFINNDKLASELGVKYNDIRSFVINDKTKKFLSNI